MVSLSLKLCEPINPECPQGSAWLAAGLTRMWGNPASEKAGSLGITQLTYLLSRTGRWGPGEQDGETCLKSQGTLVAEVGGHLPFLGPFSCSQLGPRVLLAVFIGTTLIHSAGLPLLP